MRPKRGQMRHREAEWVRERPNEAQSGWGTEIPKRDPMKREAHRGTERLDEAESAGSPIRHRETQKRPNEAEAGLMRHREAWCRVRPNKAKSGTRKRPWIKAERRLQNEAEWRLCNEAIRRLQKEAKMRQEWMRLKEAYGKRPIWGWNEACRKWPNEAGRNEAKMRPKEACWKRLNWASFLVNLAAFFFLMRHFEGFSEAN